MTLLSIITVTFRDPQGLLATIESLKPILGSEYTWEHVVIDSSPSVNQEVLDELPQDWPIRHVTQDPKGIYAAMNFGIAQSHGQLIWLLNSADRLKDPSALLQAVQRLTAQPDIQILCHAVDRVRDGVHQYTWKPGRDFSRSLIGFNGVCHQGMIYRREVFEKIGDFSTRYILGGDYDHHLRCVLAEVKVALSDQVLAAFDVSGIGSKRYHLEFEELRAIQRAYYAQFDLQTRMSHEVARNIHRLKVLALKTAQNHKATQLLRPLWLAWKRRSS